MIRDIWEPVESSCNCAALSGTPSYSIESFGGMGEGVGLLWGHQKRKKEGVMVLLMRRKGFSKELELEVIDTVCQKDKGRAIS